MGPARTHRVFRGANGATASSTATHSQREHAELISIQPLDYESWLAAWSGNEGEDPLSTDASRVAPAARRHGLGGQNWEEGHG